MKEGDILSIEEAWGYSLIGFLVGAVPSPRIVKDLMKGWEVPCKFSFHRNDWILFEFENQESMKKVRDMGAHMSYGRSWIIKEVPKLFAFADSCFSSVPIWVNLRSLPKQLWSRKALSKIGSQIGKPICTDRITGERLFHDCARILVEVDVTKEPKKVLPIKMPDGRMWDQPLEYEVQPVICTKCRSLGHSGETCQGRRPDPLRRQTETVRGRSASKNPVTRMQAKDKGKAHMDVQTDAGGQAQIGLTEPTIGPRAAGVVIRESTVPVQQMEECATTPKRQNETVTPRVETPNPFAILATSEGHSGGTRAEVQFEEEASPLMIQALTQDEDLLEEDDIDEEALQYRTEIQIIQDETVRMEVPKGRRRRIRGAGAQ